MRIIFVISVLCLGFQVESLSYMFKKLSKQSEQKENKQWLDIHEICHYNDLQSSIRNIKKDSSDDEKIRLDELVTYYFSKVKEILYSTKKYSDDVLRFLDAEQQTIFLEYLKKYEEIDMEPNQEVTSMDM